MTVDDLKAKIRDIEDFPKAGIIFKDITPLLADAQAFKFAIDKMAQQYADKNIDLVLGAEARGFIFASTLAYKLGAGFIPARKPGKLPYTVTKAEYALEYGVDSLEMHDDAITRGHRVLVVDDVLATGGTAAAKVQLVECMGGIVVGVAFLIELTFLSGREKLKNHNIFSLIKY
jgi:adenine phosphoribosyltransferase